MEIKKTIRVVLADDHVMVRQGIRRNLEKASNILVVGEAGTGLAALNLVRELRPDVLLLDHEMPDMKGLQVAWELRKSNIPISIVMLSACDDQHFIEETLRTGVDGYLNKSEPSARIREMILWAFGKYAASIAPLFFLFLSKMSLALVQAFSN